MGDLHTAWCDIHASCAPSILHRCSRTAMCLDTLGGKVPYSCICVPHGLMWLMLYVANQSRGSLVKDDSCSAQHVVISGSATPTNLRKVDPKAVVACVSLHKDLHMVVCTWMYACHVDGTKDAWTHASARPLLHVSPHAVVLPYQHSRAWPVVFCLALSARDLCISSIFYRDTQMKLSDCW